MQSQRMFDRLESYLSFLSEYPEKHFFHTILFFFIVSLLVRAAFAPFDYIVGKDPFFYVLKAKQIVHGDFSPLLTHAIGWPLFMAPFFLAAGDPSVFEGIVYARMLCVFASALVVFPLAYLAKELLGRRNAGIVLAFYSFYPEMVFSGTEALAEPLFLLLFLAALYYLVKSREDAKNVLYSSFFGALSYYVRFNAVFVLPIILVAFYLMRKHIKGFRYSYFVYTILVFSIVSFPMLYSRFLAFGSPFDYGPNSKYLVDNYDQAWSDNIASPTIQDYLKTHWIRDYADKFLVHGFFFIFYQFVYSSISPELLFFFFYGVLLCCRKDGFEPLVASFVVWMIAFVPAWSIFGIPRHLYVLVPPALVFIVAAAEDLFGNTGRKNSLFALLLAVFILLSVRSTVQMMEEYRALEAELKEGLAWAQWVSGNVKGKIALAGGWDLVMMYLPDTRQGDYKTVDLYSPAAGLATLRPGYFANLSCAMEWYEKIGVTHLGVDDVSRANAPFLGEIDPQRPPAYLKETYSNYGTDSLWKIRLYEIDWVAFDESPDKGGCAA